MKVLVIPDIHLKPWIFDNAAQLMRQQIAERAICLMDIPDDWDKQCNIQLYEETFDKANEFAHNYQDTLWCFGNHDLSYLWGKFESGYSPMAAHIVKSKLSELLQVVPENAVKYIHRVDNVLFSHGGITKSFVEENIGSSLYDNVDLIIQAINEFDGSQMWRDDSPIWARPQITRQKLYRSDDFLQIVGHTPVQKIQYERNLISCDTFSTYRNGIPIGTQKFLLLDTVTWEFDEVGANE